MTNLTFKEQPVSFSNRHFDYEKNLKWGYKFIQNFNNGFDGKEFMISAQKNSDGKYYFTLSFKPEGNHPSYANIVNPNQDYESFFKEFNATSSIYFDMQKKWNKRPKAA